MKFGPLKWFTLMIDNICIPNLALIAEIMVIVLLIIGAGGALIITNLHSFLAKNIPINTDILVVKG
jgi:hypothetical protein